MTPQQLAQKTWDLYQSHGVPIEVSEDILARNGLTLDGELLSSLIQEHQTKSQVSSQGQFRSGLGGDSSKIRQLHTLTHIVHSQLREMFGTSIKQMGSAITEEKARFDFSYSNPLSDEELKTLENSVQSIIEKKLTMVGEQMTSDQAVESGAIGLFGEKYGEIVTVYTLKDNDGNVYSREYCAGPHIDSTDSLGTFKILKQKSVGQGVRRIEFDIE